MKLPACSSGNLLRRRPCSPGWRPETKYFLINPSWWGGGGFPRIDFANLERICPPGVHTLDPPTGDPGQYAEPPRLVHLPVKRPDQGLPRDFECLAGLWIVSEALKSIFQAVDPEAFAFSECDFVLSDGSIGPKLYLCNVVRILDALDEEASRLKIKVGDYEMGKYYSLAGGASLRFHPSVVESAHIFRTPYSDWVICDRLMRDTLKSAGLRGLSLKDAQRDC